MPRYSGLFRTAALFVCAFGSVSLLFAVDTHVWQQDEQSEFNRGTIKHLSVRSDGHITLAPAFRELADTGVPYLWSIVQDSHGTLYCAGGAPTGATTKIYSVAPRGGSHVVAELTALEVHALALDKQDRLYAATSPDSKVYRIGRDGKPELFFDTKAKYVWAMAFDKSGNLYVATGDEGVIYRVTPDGKGTEFFRTEETNARSMIVDSHGDLIVGTEPGGYITRITPQGKSFVLFQTGKREVTSVAEHDGVLYAAAVGGKPAQPSLAAPARTTPHPAAGASAGSKAIVTVQPGATPPAAGMLSLTAPAPAVAGGSEVYRIDQDGFAEKLWSSTKDVVYAIGFDPDGKPLLGTGNKGVIYRIDSSVLATQLINAPPTQVTSFLAGKDGLTYAVTGNVGKVYAIGPSYEKAGSLESEVLDVGSFAYWGGAYLQSELDGGTVSIETRSGNVNRPQKNWSEWQPVELRSLNGSVASPPARFLQYRLTLKASAQSKSPDVGSIEIGYLPKNIAPVVREIEIADANYRASTSTFLERNVEPSGSALTLTLPPIGNRKGASTPVRLEGAGGMTLQYAKSYVTARWAASDANGDALTYKVEIRGERESLWRFLKDKVQESYLSFDSSAFPDGKYIIRVTASDAPSNTPAAALSASLESDPFVIDNTPPQVIAGGVKEESGATLIEFTAKDASSWINKTEYSVNGGDWTLLDPVTKVSDGKELHYQLRIPKSAAHEQQMIAVRVFDENDNGTVQRFVAP
jgi:hypothetical protein